MERGRKAAFRFAAAAAAAATVLLAAWAMRGTVQRGPAVGQPLPDVLLSDLDGRPSSLGQWRGRPLVIRVSSRSCQFCSNDFALLADLQARHPGVQVLAVELGDRGAVLRELRGRRPPYPVLVDADGASARRWALPGLPSFVFADREGRFVGSMWGELGMEKGLATVEAYIARIAPQAAASQDFRDLTPQELADLLRSQDVVLVNVHVPYEGRIPGTDLLIPYDRIDAERAQLPADARAPIVVYCMTGRMSAIAARRLVELGYTQVMNLAGGMVAWRQAGFPLEP